MIAVDTNVVVRLIADDDKAQADRVEELLARDSVFVPKTVLLETEWVLRSAYRLPREAIAEGLRGFLALEAVTVEDGAAVTRALDWFARGLDFADALHLASAGEAAAFASFDRKLANGAAGLADAPEVVTP